MPKSDLRVPHFLRVTQALAFVSGFGLPAALAACGGEFSAGGGGPAASECGDPCAAVSPASDGSGGTDEGYSGRLLSGDDSSAPAPYDGSVVGVTGPLHPITPNPPGPPPDDGPDGAPDATLAYDGSPLGVVPYDGSPVGVVVPPSDASFYDGFPLGVVVHPSDASAYDGFPLGVVVHPYDGGPIGVGGPLSAPDLPA